MSADADRLDNAASALSDSAWRLDDSIRRLSNRVQEQVVFAALGWKGPAADQFWRETQDRVGRISRTRDSMNSLAGQMRREASALRDEERRQAAQSHHR